MLMGIADLVPGISGGTIALITGIYKDLITALNNLTFKNIKFNFLKNSKKNKFDILAFLAVGISLSILCKVEIIIFVFYLSYINIFHTFIQEDPKVT